MGDKIVSRDFTVLDGGAIILGSAIAAVHVRLATPEPRGWLGWALASSLFAWITLTASGPFLYISRKFGFRSGRTYPTIGDRLWILWGCPWVISALVESLKHPGPSTAGRLDPIYVGSLGLGLFLATMIGVPILAARYLWGEPGSARRSGDVSWTQRVGLALTAIWPIQCGVGLVLMG